MDEGKIEQAITILSDLVRKEPKVAGAEASLGKAYYQKRDYPQAISHSSGRSRKSPTTANRRSC